MLTKYSLTAVEARKMLDAVREEAARRQLTPSIAITDEAGYLLVFERIDGAKPYSADVAIRKTQTAAQMGRSTKGLAEDIVKRPHNAAIFPDRTPIQGGLPVIYQGVCAGAIGVSGIASFDEADELAAIGIAALGL